MKTKETPPIPRDNERLYSKVLAVVGLGLLGATLAANAGQGPMPSICNRACWGARASTGCATIPVLNRAIIHHTAGNSHFNTTSIETSKANMRGLQNYDMDSKGYCDIIYHFMIDKLGNIFEARANSISGLPNGSHDAKNSGSFGFTLMGNFADFSEGGGANQIPTAIMITRMYDVIAWRMPSAWSPFGSGAYGSYGSSVGWLDGHRKVTGAATACPGNNVYNVYITDNKSGGTMRNEINARKNGGGGGGGATGVTNPDYNTVIRNNDGRLEIFAIAQDTAVWHNFQWGGAWSGWLSLGGSGFADVCAGKNADGRPQVFAIGTDNNVWSSYMDPAGNWSGFFSMGGWLKEVTIGPNNTDGRMEIFGIASDGSVWRNAQVAPNAGWTGWISLGMAGMKEISASKQADGRLQLFAINSANNVWSTCQTSPGGGWAAWGNHGGGVAKISPALHSNGLQEVFVIGTDTVMYSMWQNTPNGSWTGWGSMGGGYFTKLANAVNLNGAMEVFALSSDSQIYHNWAPGWSGWSVMNGSSMRSVAVAANSDGRLEAFGVSVWDSQMWHSWQTSPGGGWSAWSSLGGGLK